MVRPLLWFLIIMRHSMLRIVSPFLFASCAAPSPAADDAICDEALAVVSAPSIEWLALDQALERLADGYPRQSQVAELRVLAGMTVTEIAHFLGVSRRTATDDWAFARAWLARELRAER